MRFVERTTDTLPFVSIFNACRTEMIRIGSKHEFSKSTSFLVSIRITLPGARGGISTRVLSLTVGALYQLSYKGLHATWSFCDVLNANHASTGRALCRLSYRSRFKWSEVRDSNPCNESGALVYWPLYEPRMAPSPRFERG